MTRNNVEFGMIHSSLKRLNKSQSAEHEVQIKALTRVESQLLELQDQLKGETVGIPKEGVVRSVGAGKCQVSCIYQKRQTYYLPFGTIITGRPMFGRWSDGSRTRHCTFTFVPPPWLSRLIIHWELQLNRITSGFPSMTMRLSPIVYNTSPRLKAAINRFDVGELQSLFREGLARPTDYIFHRRPMTLLEVSYLVLVNHLSLIICLGCCCTNRETQCAL